MKPEEILSEEVSVCTSTRDVKMASDPNRRSKDFYRRYLALCRTKNFQPLAELTGLGRGGTHTRRDQNRPVLPVLDFYGDRFKETDWQLIAASLVEDSSLEMVAIRLRKVLSDVLENGCYRVDMITERPVILTKRLFSRLIDCLAQFLVSNTKVRVFVLEALPIQGLHMATLVNSLQQNCSITELSLTRSFIQDEGCEAICAAVMHLPKIVTLNLSGCQLTVRGCRAVAELIKYQKIQRFAKSWQYSLRYGQVDTSQMQGLRHILLSANPRVGNEGLRELTEVLKDDEWIRQMHFRNCGLTDEGAKFIVECLNINKSLEKFDIRENMGISNETCREILVKLGVEQESTDSGQSSKGTSGEESCIKMKPSEQIRCLQQQLAAERHRSSKLQLMVEQMHLQQTEFAVQMNDLRNEYNQIVKEREELLKRIINLQKVRPKSRRSNVRKSKSDNLPSVLFSRKGLNLSTKSETLLRRNGRSMPTRRTPILERHQIGDTAMNDPMAEIAALNEQLDAVQKRFGEHGCGDASIGCSKVDVWKMRSNSCGDSSEEEAYTNGSEGAVDERSANGSNSVSMNYDEDLDDDFDESASSMSGAEMLKMMVRKHHAAIGSKLR